MHRQQHASTKPVHCLEQLQYAAKRGFYFSTPKPGTGAGQKEVPPLPRDFIQVDSLRSRASVTCTTHKLNALNARLSDAATDCLVLTEQVCLPHNNSTRHCCCHFMMRLTSP